MANLKGVVIKVSRDLFKLEKNREQEKIFLESLTPDEMKIYKNTLSINWVPVDVVGQLLEKSAKLLFPGYPYPIRELGRVEAHEQLTGIYKVLLFFTTLSMLVKQAGRIFATYYDKGKVEFTQTSEKSLVVTIKEFSELPKSHIDKIGGYIAGMLELIKLNNVKLDRIDESDPNCWKYYYSWKPDM